MRVPGMVWRICDAVGELVVVVECVDDVFEGELSGSE